MVQEEVLPKSGKIGNSQRLSIVHQSVAAIESSSVLSRILRTGFRYTVELKQTQGESGSFLRWVPNS